MVCRLVWARQFRFRIFFFALKLNNVHWAKNPFPFPNVFFFLFHFSFYFHFWCEQFFCVESMKHHCQNGQMRQPMKSRKKAKRKKIDDAVAFRRDNFSSFPRFGFFFYIFIYHRVYKIFLTCLWSCSSFSLRSNQVEIIRFLFRLLFVQCLFLSWRRANEEKKMKKCDRNSAFHWIFING